MLDVTLPYEPEIEVSVLGSILLDPKCMEDVADIFHPSLFFLPKHRAIAKAVWRIWNEKPESLSYEAVALSQEVKKAGVSITEITDMVTSVVTTANVRVAVEKLALVFSKREAMRTGYELLKIHELHDETKLRDVISRLEARLAKIGEATTPSTTTATAKELSLAMLEELDSIGKNSREGVTGLPTGLTEVNKLTRGLHPQELVIVAGRPGMGKTAFMLHLAQHQARLGKSVLVFSLEMSAKMLLWRLVSREAQIPLHHILSGRLNAAEYGAVVDGLNKVSKLPIVIDDAGGMTVSQIRTKARQVRREHGLDVVYIDYLGLIHGRGENRQQEVARNVQGIKELAKELNVPIVLLAQLNRSVEQRQDKRPQLADLRESGEIEQAADKVLFLYRPDYYSDDPKGYGEAEVIVAKHRNGPIGTARVYADMRFNLFGDLAKR